MPTLYLRFVRNKFDERGDPLGDRWLNIFAKVNVLMLPEGAGGLTLAVVDDSTHLVAHARVTWEKCIEVHDTRILGNKYLYAEAVLQDVEPVRWEDLPEDDDRLSDKECRRFILKTMEDCGWMYESYTTGRHPLLASEAFVEWIQRASQIPYP